MSLPSNESSSNLLVNYGAESDEEEGELVEGVEKGATEELSPTKEADSRPPSEPTGTESDEEEGELVEGAEKGATEELSPTKEADRPPSEPTGTALLSLDVEEDEDAEEEGSKESGSGSESETEVKEEKVKGSEVKDGEVGTTIADISEDEDDRAHGVRRHSESVSLRDSFTSEPETALTQKIRRLSADQVTLPPEPKGRCSKKLQEKIAGYYRKNINMNESIQSRKDFRNPSLYEKLISYLGIDELGTNYPKDVFNPHGWDEGSYYEALAKSQKEEMAKREKEKKERTKVEFVSGVAKKPKTTTEASVLPDEDRKRKTKWDAPSQPSNNPGLSLLGRPQVTIITTSITNPTVVSTTVSATGTKTTVISAIGTIKKPKLEKVEK